MPHTRNILTFICDEVTRQGYDIDTSEGMEKVHGMFVAWRRALRSRLKQNYPTIADVLQWAYTIDERNLGGFRICNVRVGNSHCANWEDVPRLMEQVWETIETSPPDVFYVAFEKIHPFIDGNGRVGKILHNWLNGTLDDPILVKDYFGGGIP